ncbi:nucleoside-diphosphate-sugar epimerase, partial [Pseudohyphozyma bogoriensis]
GTRFVFNYLSGHGAWQEDGKASQMFGRVKGQAEKALASNFPSLATYNFRPAGILPTRPIPEASFLYRCGTPIMKAIRLVAPSMVITTEQLARGMIEAALQGSTGSIPGWEGKGKPGDKGVFDNEEIKVLAKTSPLS